MPRPTDAELISILRDAEREINRYAPKLNKHQPKWKRNEAVHSLVVSAQCGKMAYDLTPPADGSTA